MSQEKKHTKEKKQSLVKGIISYEWILKNLVFFLFLALLAVLYIANGHWADNNIRDINTATAQVKDLQYEYKSLKSIEIFKSREPQITEAATPLGLKISKEAPMAISADKKNTNNQ